MRKRRPLAKLIRDLSTGRVPSSSDRHHDHHDPAAVVKRVSPRKPPARAESRVRLARDAGRRLATSPILVALEKAARPGRLGRRRTEQKPTRDRKRGRAS
jgi:hypothetical protein